MRTQFQSLASLHGLRIWRCCELWCRSQVQLGSGVAVELCGTRISSDSTPSLRTSICLGGGPTKTKKKTKTKINPKPTTMSLLLATAIIFILKFSVLRKQITVAWPGTHLFPASLEAIAPGQGWNPHLCSKPTYGIQILSFLFLSF